MPPGPASPRLSPEPRRSNHRASRCFPARACRVADRPVATVVSACPRLPPVSPLRSKPPAVIAVVIARPPPLRAQAAKGRRQRPPPSAASPPLPSSSYPNRQRGKPLFPLSFPLFLPAGVILLVANLAASRSTSSRFDRARDFGRALSFPFPGPRPERLLPRRRPLVTAPLLFSVMSLSVPPPRSVSSP
uniref:Uncharacterized protein n=1 Tax=Oryza sativa subsp. japonica TaxID=39947 RepID=Q6YYZ7_ORYSJ|nr:hypothetical protein [Oryza sativa Japonica Group]BAD17017.1 hypothetical protein [Oryza sativa Japonica Group]